MNVVMEHLELVAEVRSFDHQKCLNQVEALETILNEEVTRFGAKLDFKAIRLSPAIIFKTPIRRSHMPNTVWKPSVVLPGLNGAAVGRMPTFLTNKAKSSSMCRSVMKDSYGRGIHSDRRVRTSRRFCLGTGPADAVLPRSVSVRGAG